MRVTGCRSPRHRDVFFPSCPPCGQKFKEAGQNLFLLLGRCRMPGRLAVTRRLKKQCALAHCLPQKSVTPPHFLSLRGVHRYTLRAAAANRKLDMSDAFEAYAGHSREANLGVMTKGRFQAAMGDIFKGVPQAALRIISREYGTGDPDRRDPGGFTHVRFKPFADDFDAIVLRKTEGPSIEEMGDMIPLMSKLRQVATKQKLDLTDAFEEVTRPCP